MSGLTIVGLTGSMGMGKSTTAQMFRDEGIPVWDADEAVRRLYAKGGAAVAPLQNLRPQTVVDGAVDRDALKDWIARDRSALKHIESIVHPLVAADRKRFLAEIDTGIAVLDIPLLFETGADSFVDVIAVVSAPEEVQRARLLERGLMDPSMIDTILAKQMPDKDKRARADYVIETLTLDGARAQVRSLLADLGEGRKDA